MKTSPEINQAEISCPSKDIHIRCFCPSEDLRFFVKYFWIVRVKDAKKINKLSEISPSGYPELIFHFGDVVSVRTSGENAPEISTDSLIAGQITQSIRLLFNNHVNSFCVKLQPYALKAFFNIKSAEFTNRATRLNDLHPKMHKDIFEQLSEAGNDKIRFEIIENRLRKLLKKNHHTIHSDTCAAINYLKNNINRKHGSLEQIMHLSKRTLQRRMMEDIGLSPKTMIKIFRFNKAYYMIKNKNLNLQDISYIMGYYDLSHLINEFKQFTGRSPVKYFKEEDVYNSLFAGIQ